MDYTTELENKVKELTLQLETEKFNAKHHEEIIAVVEKNLQAYKEALAEANETTRIWKKRYNDLSAHINSINTQNAELVAQVEMLRAALEATRQPHMDYIPKLDKTARQMLDATPAQCLRQIQADAGRAGFVAGAKYVYTSRELGYFPDVLELVSLDYVERVKAGEL